MTSDSAPPEEPRTYVVDRCQICENKQLEPVLFLGFLPPVNLMPTIGAPIRELTGFPAQILRCPRCQLVQIGMVPDPRLIFPPEYPYTSGTTKILRENFAELYQECKELVKLGPDDLIIDVGSNDGTLLSNFKADGHRVHGIEPTLVANLANERGIKTTHAFFSKQAADKVASAEGKARIVTATNVFAHMDDVHEKLDAILSMLAPDGTFVSESHYLISLVETLQYDTIYHEHLRYYSLASLEYLLKMHGLTVFHARRIPTHGGSMRVYACRSGVHPVRPSVEEFRAAEAKAGMDPARLAVFKRDVVLSKLALHALLLDIKRAGARIMGVGAPSRASTLIHYVGIDDGILDCVLEVKGSRKTGKFIPGTLIPVVDEERLFTDQPDYALLLSWHIAEELAPKLIEKGFRGRFIVPLPTPRILEARGGG